MENNDRNLARFVEERLAALEPAANFRPNSAKALARVKARERRYHTQLRWLWGSLAAAVVCLMVLIAPAPCHAASPACGQPIGVRLWDSVFSKTPVPAPVNTQLAMANPHPLPAPAPPQPSAAPPSYKWTGQSGAPLVIEIYSDFECPHCAIAYLETLPQLEAQYVRTGKVRLLHRDFPLRTHQYAMLAARYANAAGRTGVYEAVVKQLFLTQGQWSQDGDIESRLSLAISPGVLQHLHDLVQNQPDLADSINADIAMAMHDNIDRTPSLVVVFGGKRQVISGMPSLEILKGYLDDLLK